ncbi:hypothetical protein [Pseudomonas brassicacearum]|uniref:hypothetical protein n=1 Tax=Pseudomonas brassicacearum TaxID=930166 RepID=UPI0011F1A861|nr:hypothetical protein [Pseudomonas brassicacearum]QEO79867.1 hypothetical protein ELZ14_20765 [Pseudomonas brassicacearum]
MRKVVRGISVAVVFYALNGCAVQTVDSSNRFSPKEFVSVNPGKSDWVGVDTGAGVKKKYWSSLTNQQINDLLPIEKTSTSILRVQSDLSLGYAGAKYTGSSGKYVVVLDYSKYRDEVTDIGGAPCLVGVGVRVRATIVTRKSDLDLGSLFAIAFAAKSGYLSGNLEVMKIGIDSAQLKSVIPDFTEISDGSVQQAMQAVGAVKNRLYDKDTKLTPHVLAVQFPVISQQK